MDKLDECPCCMCTRTRVKARDLHVTEVLVCLVHNNIGVSRRVVHLLSPRALLSSALTCPLLIVISHLKKTFVLRKCLTFLLYQIAWYLPTYPYLVSTACEKWGKTHPQTNTQVAGLQQPFCAHVRVNYT